MVQYIQESVGKCKKRFVPGTEADAPVEDEPEMP